MQGGLVVFLSTLLFGIAAASKPVSTTVTARWSNTPLLLETAEFFSRENSASYWAFVESTLELEDVSRKSDHEIYQWIISATKPLLNARIHDVLTLSLALRFTSPAIAMYQQMSSVHEKHITNCEAFVVIGEFVTCSAEQVPVLLSRSKDEAASTDVFNFDHLYPRIESPSAVNVVLYANLGTQAFRNFHKVLVSLSHKATVTYYLRYYQNNPSKSHVHLSGYGVELDIKNTEYKAVDSKETDEEEIKNTGDLENMSGFNFKTLKKNNPDLSEELTKFQFQLKKKQEGLKPLKVWELSDLSYQTAQKILENEDPLEALKSLKEYSQNFPSHAHELSKVVVSRGLKDDISSKQNLFDGLANVGDTLLLINGIVQDVETLDPFQLFDTLYRETKLLVSLSKAGIPQKYYPSLLNLDIGVGSADDYAVDIRDESVIYMNDLENDKDRYPLPSWQRSLQYLLQPTFPGSLRRIAKHIHHTVYVFDPAEPTSIPYMNNAFDFILNTIPTRVGIVLISNPSNEVNVALCRALGFILDEEETFEAAKFLQNFYRVNKQVPLTVDQVSTAFKKRYQEVAFDDIVANSEFDRFCNLGSDFYARSGLGELPLVLYNGKPVTIAHSDYMEDTLVGEIYSGTVFWQRATWNDEINDSTNLLDFAMNQNHVMPRLNSRVLEKTAEYLDFDTYEPNTPTNSLSISQLTQYMSDELHYIAKKDPEFDKSVTLWIIADLEVPRGRALAYQALKYLKKSESMRIGIITNSDNKQSLISDAIQATLLSQTNHNAKLFITKLLNEERVQELKDGVKTLDELEITGMDSAAFKAALADKAKLKEVFNLHKFFCEKVLFLHPEHQLIVANGKIIGPFVGTEEFTYDDFGLVDKFVHVLASKSISKVLKIMTDVKAEGNQLSDLTMKVTSTLMKYAATKSRVQLRPNTFKESTSVIRVPARHEDEPYHKIVLAIDPLSRSAQKLSPVLLSLQKSLNVEISMFLNCMDKWSEMPLKSYYRYVLPSSLEFEEDGSISVIPHKAVFPVLPVAAMFTMNIQPPESWLVELVKCPYDLDNIVLKDIHENSVHAYYELAHILLEGHCYEKQSGQPPRGLQFQLGTLREPELFDTIVMANLGYFQLKANPGSWVLRLREGLSREIYEISSTKLTDTPEDSEDVVVVVRSFTNRFIHVSVSKQPGMQDRDVLGEEDESAKKTGIWDSVKSIWSTTEKEKCNGDDCPDEPSKPEVLNIFSVASGHLYERFLRVMMVSVLKHTKAPVKFWFLKNYLSPSFKDSLDKMRETFDFEYELVEYKWPRWLNGQTEKQRVIWGYKILFLDVLFPLHVKKIIFVDADQIVRADLTELRDMDLDGAPYGYTPFCDDKTEMDGFRFWKSGYWANHLAGRKYHISALYVIDLAKFRKIMAGDRLRGQYQGLSQDPNSLANLDQDLPNNMIHQVRIKSLPQDWLWCETWCSDSSLRSAKTIDLCNNPLTKEPKLQRAMRIVPEWKEYDDEIRAVLEASSDSSTTRASGGTDEKSEHIHKEF